MALPLQQSNMDMPSCPTKYSTSELLDIFCMLTMYIPDHIWIYNDENQTTSSTKVFYFISMEYFGIFRLRQTQLRNSKQKNSSNIVLLYMYTRLKNIATQEIGIFWQSYEMKKVPIWHVCGNSFFNFDYWG